MAFREVTLEEVREVLRQWLMGTSGREIGRRTGVDRGTVRRYVGAAISSGLEPGSEEAVLDDARLAEVLGRLPSTPARERGEGWACCEANREVIAARIASGVKLKKVQRLLAREGVAIPYTTLWRFANTEFGFGEQRTTLPVLDGEPGQELQVDTARVGRIAEDGRERVFKAWIFTAARSRHRFVFVSWRETTEDAIEACEAAWAFFGGVFRVLIPDNTTAIVTKADALAPLITPKFLEYAQSRGFVIDPARVRAPKDKGRVERSVQTVRDDCFGGETLRSLADAQRRAESWCLSEYGLRPHSTTARRPLEVFEAEERPCLLPAPTERYEVPLWVEAKVSRDQRVIVAGALYSVGGELVGRRVTARADRTTVRIYADRLLVKTHARVPKGKQSNDPRDYPPERAALAFRDAEFFRSQAAKHGEAVGGFAAKLLESDQPWTKLRAASWLLRVVQRFGATRVEPVCRRLLDQDAVDVRRLERLLQQGVDEPMRPVGQVIQLSKYLRPVHQYRLPLAPPADTPEETR
jgi:transposase